jgi:hypothetical protein
MHFIPRSVSQSAGMEGGMENVWPHGEHVARVEDPVGEGCSALRCYAMLCYAMLYYAMLFCSTL